MIYSNPGSEGSSVSFESRYENFIGGKWVAPVDGQYFKNTSPVTGEVICEMPRSNRSDIELALDAAHAAKAGWGSTSVQERSNILLQIADRIESNLELFAITDTWDNGKPIRETVNADIPLAVDHFRYFAGCLRADEGATAYIDDNTTSTHVFEPLGVVGQIIPWNFPLLMAAWKLGPALAAGNCVVLKPAEQTPLSVTLLMELIGDIVPAGVINVVQGFGEEAGDALSKSTRIAKLAFTGSTEVGKQVSLNAAKNMIPCTVELGGKSPNLIFPDVFDHGEEYTNKVIEGIVLAYFNQGEVCTCPSRVLIHADVFDRVTALAVERIAKITRGNPLDDSVMMGAQASAEQFDKIMTYMTLAEKEGEILIGGEACNFDDDSLKSGYYIQPTLVKTDNDTRIAQEEIFGPVVCAIPFESVEQAIEIANDTTFGLGAGVWTQNTHLLHETSNKIQAGRIWQNCYHAYPAHSAFGGYKESGIGRETHKVALDSYRQVKNLLCSYDVNPLGFF